MQTHTLTLQFPPQQTRDLKRELYRLNRAMRDTHGELPDDYRAELRRLLTGALNPLLPPGGLSALSDRAQPQWQRLHLLPGDAPELLNFPWQIVASDAPRLLITKGIAELKGEYLPELPLPLKVLVMVASPEEGGSTRLSYEAEETVILDALAPLMREGLAEVSFTDDGSLESLRRALRGNDWHVLYFSGHGTMYARNPAEPPKAMLDLEDEYSMEAIHTPAMDFADALRQSAGRVPPLVVLAACESGQVSTDSDLGGAAACLLAVGVPAVLSMGWETRDQWATHFAKAFFRAMAEQSPLPEAYHSALEDAQKPYMSQHRLTAELLATQAMIPQLFASRTTSQLVDWSSPEKQPLNRQGAYLLDGDTPLSKKLQKVNRVFGRPRQDFLFIGRRRERKAALRSLREQGAILLLGQGGMGKTAMAVHLAMRFVSADPDRCVPFAFDQNNTSFDDLCNALLDYLETDRQQHSLRADVSLIPEAQNRFSRLLREVELSDAKPLFIFDNLESFQPEGGGPLREDIKELLGYLIRSNHPVLCTGRYPLEDFEAGN
jgi:hypothetical protein